MSETKTGPELIQEIVSNESNITLDTVLDRAGRSVSDNELTALVDHLRLERAHIEVKQEKAKEKKRGQEDTE